MNKWRKRIDNLEFGLLAEPAQPAIVQIIGEIGPTPEQDEEAAVAAKHGAQLIRIEFKNCALPRPA